MRIFWVYAPNEGGEIWIRDSPAKRMYYLTNYRKEHPCPHCKRTIWPTTPGRIRWLQYKAERFYPRMMPLPPGGKPLLARPDWGADLRDFLIRVVRMLPKGSRYWNFRYTPTGVPQGILYVWWRMEDVPAGHPKLREGRYLDISPYFVPGRGQIEASEWAAMREEIPVGFPRDIVPG